MVDDFRAGAGPETGELPTRRRRGDEIAAYYQRLFADQRIDLYHCDRHAAEAQRPAPERSDRPVPVGASNRHRPRGASSCLQVIRSASSSAFGPSAGVGRQPLA
jgi:hypothetical protein